MNGYGKLNPWVKRRWVKALRSGEYLPGRGDLIEDGGPGAYCCLGVLVAEEAPEFLCRTNFGTEVGMGSGYVSVKGKPHYSTVPDDLAVTWGLTDEAQDKLVGMNDEGQGFKRIATWIDRNL